MVHFKTAGWKMKTSDGENPRLPPPYKYHPARTSLRILNKERVFELEIAVNIILCTLVQGMPVTCEMSRVDRCVSLSPERGLVPGLLYPSCRFSSADCHCQCFHVFNPCREIHSAALVHHIALRYRDFFIRIASSSDIS